MCGAAKLMFFYTPSVCNPQVLINLRDMHHENLLRQNSFAGYQSHDLATTSTLRGCPERGIPC
jgi:hypothetical protein